MAVSRWEFLGETPMVKTRIFDLVARRFRHPLSKREDDFFAIKTKSWANIAALTPDQRVVLVKQFRFGVEAFSLEFPGGIVDPGEDPKAAALRELREETGYTGGPAVSIGSSFPNPAIFNNTCHFFKVETVEKTHALSLDQNEDIEVIVAPLDEVIEWGRSGKFTHALALNCLFMLLSDLGRL
ncbi:MAG: NUDIX hydrolase [Verrucomicrobiota bacterium]